MSKEYQFDTMGLHFVSKIEIKDVETVETSTWRSIVIYFGDDNHHLTIACHGKDIEMDIHGLQDDLDALRNAPFIKPEAE